MIAMHFEGVFIIYRFHEILYGCFVAFEDFDMENGLEFIYRFDRAA